MNGNTKIWGKTIKAWAIDNAASRIQENGKDAEEAVAYLVRLSQVSKSGTADNMIGQYIGGLVNIDGLVKECKAEHARQYRGR